MKTKKNIIFISIISISLLILLFFKINQNENKKLGLKQKVEVESSGIVLKTTSNLQSSVEQELFNSNVFDNIISNENITSDDNITNSTENFVSLEIMLSGELNNPFEGNISIQTRDLLNVYPRQNLKKEISGNYLILFEKIHPADCKIIAEIKGYFSISTNFSLEKYAGTKTTVLLSLEPSQALCGKVIDYASKEEIAGVELSTLDQITFTDGAGRFQIENLPSKVVKLKVVHDNYPTQTFSVTIPNFDEPDIILELRNTSKISGYVFNQNGEAIPECKVIIPELWIQNNKILSHFSSSFLKQTMTDSEGYFEFEFIKKDPSIVRFLADTGNAHGYTDLKFNPGENHNITIIITNAFSWLEVVVRDTNAKPVTNVKIGILYKIADNNNCGCGIFAQKTSPDGTYLFCYEFSRTLNEVDVSSEGFLTESLTNIFIRFNYTTTVEFVLLPATGELIGKVKRSDGRPAIKKFIRFIKIKDSKVSKYVFTDLAGNFLIPSIESEAYYTISSLYKIVEPEKPVKGSDYIDIKLAPYSEVRFRALATNSYEVLHSMKQRVSREFPTDDRYANIIRLKNNLYTLTVRGVGYYYLYLKSPGYKPIIIHRKFNPDEDVDLGTIYFTPQNKAKQNSNNEKTI